jgi:hypothetical protein
LTPEKNSPLRPANTANHRVTEITEKYIALYFSVISVTLWLALFIWGYFAAQQDEVAEQHSPLPEQQSTFFTLLVAQHGLPSKQHALPSKQQLSLAQHGLPSKQQGLPSKQQLPPSQHGLPSKQHAAPGVQQFEVAVVECDLVAATPPSSALRTMATPTNSFANMDFLQ